MPVPNYKINIFDITVSLPCYQRPQRTLRAINDLLNQVGDMSVELLITCDGDPELFKIIKRHLDSRNIKRFKDVHMMDTTALTYVYNNFAIILCNMSIHTGFWGYAIRNAHIGVAKGKYFIFMGSDDVLLSDHISHYLYEIKGTPLQFMAFDSYVQPYKAPRNCQFKEGMIGHSELIVRTDFLKTMPPHEPVYGHDWTLVKNMMQEAGAGWYKKGGGQPTYIVKSVPGNLETGID